MVSGTINRTPHRARAIGPHQSPALHPAHLLLRPRKALLQWQELAGAGALLALRSQGGLRSLQLALALSHSAARRLQLLARAPSCCCSGVDVCVCTAAGLLQQARLHLGQGRGLVLGRLLALHGGKALGVGGHAALLRVPRSAFNAFVLKRLEHIAPLRPAVQQHPLGSGPAPAPTSTARLPCTSASALRVRRSSSAAAATSSFHRPGGQAGWRG